MIIHYCLDLFHNALYVYYIVSYEFTNSMDSFLIIPQNYTIFKTNVQQLFYVFFSKDVYQIK